MLLGLAKANAGIDDDFAARNSGFLAYADPRFECVENIEGGIVIMRIVLHRRRNALHVHEHDKGAGLGRHRNASRIAAVPSLRRPLNSS